MALSSLLASLPTPDTPTLPPSCSRCLRSPLRSSAAALACACACASSPTGLGYTHPGHLPYTHARSLRSGNAFFRILGVSAYSMQAGGKSYFYMNMEPRKWLTATVASMPDPATRGFWERVNAAHLNQLENLPYAISCIGVALAMGADRAIIDYISCFYLGATALYIAVYLPTQNIWLGLLRTTFFTFRLLLPVFALGTGFAARRKHSHLLGFPFVAWSIVNFTVPFAGFCGILFGVAGARRVDGAQAGQFVADQLAKAEGDDVKATPKQHEAL